MTAKDKEQNIEEILTKPILGKSWNTALDSWGHPSIPTVVNVEDCSQHGEIGQALKKELAFMRYPEFQTYANLQRIREVFSDANKGYSAIALHEVGHRFCPYDKITAFFLARKAEQGLAEANKKNAKALAGHVLNLFSDTCINIRSIRNGNEGLVWAYQELSKDKKRSQSPLWHVYMHSYERVLGKSMLEKDVKLTENEQNAAKELANLFIDKNPMEKAWWEIGIRDYARIIAPFLDEKSAEHTRAIDNSGAESIPTPEQTKELLGEIARRLAKPGTDGLPTNPEAVKEFRDVMAGLGEGNIIKASIAFYEQLASKYNVKFATQPYGRERTSPFTTNKWCPSDPVGELDIPQTVLTSGIVIPGVTTQRWKSRTTTIKGGETECIPSLDILLDSSGSMPNPVETVSLPALAGMVAARRAQKQGVRALNYSYKCVEVKRTTNLEEIYANLVLYQNGGTVFPIAEFLARPEEDPRLSLIITDTFIANIDEAIAAIKQFKARNKDNKVTIYAITNLPNVEQLRQAGAECIHGTTPNIFKHVLGKTEKTYLKEEA